VPKLIVLLLLTALVCSGCQSPPSAPRILSTQCPELTPVPANVAQKREQNFQKELLDFLQSSPVVVTKPLPSSPLLKP